MDKKRLWAKSKGKDEGFSESMLLPQHLKDVHAAAKRVLDATADDQLRALGLELNDYRDRLYRCVLLAAALHDLGKANDHFQGMITGARNAQIYPQGLRHEWVTVVLMSMLKSWLLPAVANSDIDFTVVKWAIAGHHPASNHPTPPTQRPDGAGAVIKLRTMDDDFQICLKWLQTTFLLDAPPPLLTVSELSLAGSGSIFDTLATWAAKSRRIWALKLAGANDRKFVAAVKNCLIAADISGSALPKAISDDSQRWDWITQSFATKPEPGDLQRIVDHRLAGATPRSFQWNVARATALVTLVKAGCGSGKTLAAYMWAAQNYPNRRLYFCYPTTGTATEGFRDYLFEPDRELAGIGARLFHSRRDIDFEILLNTGGDMDSAEIDLQARLESLEAWSTPIVACTVDTVLGLMQNNKRGLFAWPALAQSAFIFDEIHAYDNRLFGALLRFLRELPGLPALLMTASLPKAREDALRTVLKEREIELTPIPGPVELEQLPRYHKATIINNDPLPLIAAEWDSGGKILWVCNTVNRVMEAADRAEKFAPLIYHSRFKYVDRIERHAAVVEAFDPKADGRKLAITSQVCEMSLDLKGCTLLIMDVCPVTSAIQRLGRLNRQAMDGSPTRPFVFVEPDSSLPYSGEELAECRAWHARLPADAISQAQLVMAWEQAADDEPCPIDSTWLDGGYRTEVSSLREASQGITVVMREDIPRIKKPKDIGRYVLPMPTPKGMDWKSWRKFRGIPIAEPGIIKYDRMRGADWNIA